MKRRLKRLRDYCPYPQSSAYQFLRQYSKPIISLATIAIIGVSLFVASSLFMHSVLPPPPKMPPSATSTPSVTATPSNQPTKTPSSTANPNSNPTPTASPTPSPTLNKAPYGTTFGGTTYASPSSMVQTKDGGFLVTGEVDNFAALIKFSSDSSVEWNKTYGGSSSMATCVIQTSDGGYALTGYSHFQALNSSYQSVSGQNLYFAKIDAQGNLQFNETTGFGAFTSSSEIIQTSDGGYAIAVNFGEEGGHGPYSGVWKIDANGAEQWRSSFIGNAESLQLLQTSDGGYLAVGFTSNSNPVPVGSASSPSNVSLVKLAANGTQQWVKLYGNGTEYGQDIIGTPDGGYAIAAYTTGYGAGSGDMLLIKTDSAGNMLWNRTYGGEGNEDVTHIISTSDGGYALIGKTTSTGAGQEDIYLVKTDVNGNQLWNTTYGGSQSDVGYGLVQMGSGGYAVVGSTRSFDAGNSEIWLILTNSAGKPLS